MPAPFKLRNLLFAPGDSTRKAEKAAASIADAIILDLEDSVAPPNKPQARALVAALLPTLHRPGLVVRINPPDTPFYLADLAAIVPARPAAIMLPKCTGAHDLIRLDHHLEALEAASNHPIGSIGIIAIVTETAASLHNMDYRTAPARTQALCFGAEDLSADLGIDPRTPTGYPAPIQAARAATLLAAAAANLPAIDTPWPDPTNPQGLAEEAARAAADGFTGKLCIHPNQLEAAAAAFTPTPTQIEWAHQVQTGFATRPTEGVFLLTAK